MDKTILSLVIILILFLIFEYYNGILLNKKVKPCDECDSYNVSRRFEDDELAAEMMMMIDKKIEKLVLHLESHYGQNDKIIESPLHPYSQYLISSIPRMDGDYMEEASIVNNETQSAGFESAGCPFAPRCTKRLPECFESFPHRKILNEDHIVYCHLFEKEGG